MKRFGIVLSIAAGLGVPMLPARPVRHSATSIHVCVGVDRVLRFLPKGACAAGEVSYDLSLDVDEPPSPDEDKTDSKEIAELKKTIDFLRTRVSNLEHELASESNAKDHLSQKVIAPFVVVDHAGKVILRVRDDLHGIEMVNPSGQTVLWASALDKGGVIKTRSSATFPEVVMGSSGSVGGFVIRDAEDQARGSFSLTDGKPSLELSNENHTGIVSINQGKTGGGFLQLGAAGGQAAVQAGVTAGGSCGRVDAYPLTSSGRTLVGAPPSFILGRC